MYTANQFGRSVASTLAIAGLVLSSFVSLTAPQIVKANHDPFNGALQTSVLFCHSTGNGGFNSPNSSVTATGGQVNVPQGHAGHDDDIIPPFHFDGGSYPGQNWNESTEDIWANGTCTGDGVVDPVETDLSITKTASDTTPDEGTNVTFTITVTNNGGDAATGVVANDLLPAGLSYVSHNTVNGTYDSGTGVWAIGSLANGAQAILSLVAALGINTGGSQITNTATVDGTETDPDSTDNSSSVILSVSDVVNPPPVDACPNETTDPGFQEQGPCNADDVCPNDPGIQTNPDLCTPPPVETTTIQVTKIVCDNESDLPNWASLVGGAGDIDSNTASTFVQENPNCSLASGWTFQWAQGNGDLLAVEDENSTTPAGEPWTSFGPTNGDGVATVSVNSNFGGDTWVREVLQSGFVPFAGVGSESDVSAELYCNQDGENYDNMDVASPLETDGTVYCVAFNAAVEQPPVDACPNETTDPGVQTEGPCNSDDVCPNDEGIQTSTEQCTQPETPQTPTKPQCDDGIDNDGDGDIDLGTDAGCESGTDNDESNDPSSGGGGSFRRGGGSSGGQVLGATTDECPMYLHEYIKWGSAGNNPSEVTLLQEFLNDFEAFNLSVNGTYDAPTHNAVHAFQTKYLNEIMIPWGATQSSGYVYYTTRKHINEIYCKFTKEFPLDSQQEAEIARVKALGAAWKPTSEGGATSPSVPVGGQVQLPSTLPATQPQDDEETPEVGSSDDAGQSASPANAGQGGNWWTNFWNWLTGN